MTWDLAAEADIRYVRLLGGYPNPLQAKRIRLRATASKGQAGVHVRACHQRQEKADEQTRCEAEASDYASGGRDQEVLAVGNTDAADENANDQHRTQCSWTPGPSLTQLKPLCLHSVHTLV